MNTTWPDVALFAIFVVWMLGLYLILSKSWR